MRNPANNKKLWASLEKWLPLLDELRRLSRKEAYQRFKGLRRSRHLPGMGPSFFTKLIFFFGSGDGYILDQWLAKAVQALDAANWVVGATGEPQFRLAGKGFPRLIAGGKGVHDSNSAEDYEAYCSAIESLTPLLDRVDGADTERWLFSYPGSRWRQMLAALTRRR